MLFCQQCGASNSDDARFCNQCGGKIADAGEPGGPLPVADPAPGSEAALRSEATLQGHSEPAPRAKEIEPPLHPSLDKEPAPPSSRRSLPGGHEPSQGFDVSTINLSAIGVRSRGKAWGVLLGSVLALIGLGALGMWLFMNADPGSEAVAEVDPPLPDDPFPPEEVEIGDPLPEGSEPPVDFIPGSPRPSSSARTPSKRTPATRPASRTGGTTGSSSSGSSGSSSSGSGSSASTGGASSGTGSSGTGSSGTGSTGTGSSASTGTGSTGTGSTGTGSSGTSSSGGQGTSDTIPDDPDWAAMEEDDTEMDEYAARVRSVVRQYYARRAQTCFERETRNEQSVRGTVVIGFDILADGNIDNTEVARNTTGLDTLGRCLAAQVGSWRLPPPPEAPLAMQMPFSR